MILCGSFHITTSAIPVPIYFGIRSVLVPVPLKFCLNKPLFLMRVVFFFIYDDDKVKAYLSLLVYREYGKFSVLNSSLFVC